MYKGLRDYVSFLESKGELIRVKEFVDPIYEITEYTDRMSKLEGGGKAILFENTGTEFPVLTNMMGSEKRILYTLGAESFDDISGRIDSLLTEAMGEKNSIMSKLKLLPTLAEAAKWMPKNFKGKPKCQEVINNTPDINLLPVLKCWPQDGGAFVTLPLVHTNSPITGQRNVGMYRMQIFSKDTTGMHWHRHKTGATHFDEFEGDKMPVAVCLGGDPVYTYAATAPLPPGIDEYLLAGFLRGKGVELTECLTQPIKVPADCDFVIEGYVDKNEAKIIEGPFGDHTGFYSLEDLYPTFHITCITHRKDAIYPATIVGVPPQEDKYIALATEKIFLSPIKFALGPEIEDLYLPEEGVGHNFAVVLIKKRYPGQAVKIAQAMWGAGQMMFNKVILVVDSNNFKGSIRDHKALRDYIIDNYKPRRDSYFSKGPLDVLDHTANVCGFGGKLCIDATAKLPEELGISLDIFVGNGNYVGSGRSDNASGSGSFVDETSMLLRTKNAKEKYFIRFIHPDDEVPEDTLIAVILDKEHELDNIYRNLWLLGGNVDMERDSSFAQFYRLNGSTTEVLVLDAQKKVTGVNGFNRRWPDIVTSSSKTIKRVDEVFFY